MTSTDPDVMRSARELFFKIAFGRDIEGWVCIAYMTKSKGWTEKVFKWPDQLENMLADIEKNYQGHNVYYCPQVLADPQYRRPGGKSPRAIENVLGCPSIWADLDTCNPNLLLVEPTVSIESSPGRFQALWVLDEPVSPEVAQQISKNIAYHHVPDGADSGGWDITQMLRVPGTYNLKRDLPAVVTVIKATRTSVPLTAFEEYQESRINTAGEDPMPEILPTMDPLDIIQKYRKSVNPIVFSLYSVEPQELEGGWSKALWQLEMLCFEAGMSREEVFTIASSAACNKYKRDNKNPRLLWQEVCKAYAASVEKLNILVTEDDVREPLISDSELAMIKGYETFVERYIKWASSLGDAAKQYHQAGAFMILSSILAGAVRLPTSFGTIMPNLWFMLLADTTLTRKSTAMDIANDLVDEVDPDVLMATDGSLEGLMQSLEIRPGRPSLFLRDEVSGLIESMSRKDYMAGMAEALTKLYDGKTMKRVLKRETVTVKEPCLLFFAGGIKTRVQSLLTLEHVASGFVPRFIFITAQSDVSKLKPLGPPTADKLEEREAILDELRTISDRYNATTELIVKGQLTRFSELRTYAHLSEDAWERYNQLEATLLYAGVNSDQPDIMTPVYDRLAKSILKASVLIAAARCADDDEIEVTLHDLLIAIRYGQGWKEHAEEIVNGIGRTANEVLLQRIYNSIRKHPGVARSRLMQWYHLEARQADIIFNTLEQRGLVISTRMGRTSVYNAVGGREYNDDGTAK